MERIEDFLKKVSRLFDRIAGWGIFALMTLVLINILLRVFWGHPLLGVYEYVGFIAAIIIGLALSYCYIQDAHISISFITDKLSHKAQRILYISTNSLAVLFVGFFSYELVIYALKTAASGEVSTTTRILTYPFIFIVALGLLLLCLVMLARLINNLRTVEKK